MVTGAGSGGRGAGVTGRGVTGGGVTGRGATRGAGSGRGLGVGSGTGLGVGGEGLGVTSGVGRGAGVAGSGGIGGLTGCGFGFGVASGLGVAGMVRISSRARRNCRFFSASLCCANNAVAPSHRHKQSSQRGRRTARMVGESKWRVSSEECARRTKRLAQPALDTPRAAIPHSPACDHFSRAGSSPRSPWRWP